MIGRTMVDDGRREDRRKVLLRARMRASALPIDICIRDVSPSGLLVQAAAPPCRGTYVEIMFGAHSIVGQVRWVKDRRFGVHAGRRIDVDALLDSPKLIKAPPPAARAQPRRRAADTFQRSRETSTVLQFISVAAMSLIATIWIVSFVYGSALEGFDPVVRALVAQS